MMIFKKVKWWWFRIWKRLGRSYLARFFRFLWRFPVWFVNFVNWRFLEQPIPKIGLTLFAGAFFAIWWEDRLTSGKVNFKYEKPIIAITLNKDHRFAPKEIDYTVPIIVQNKTNTAFDISASFNYGLEDLEKKYNWQRLPDEESKKVNDRTNNYAWIFTESWDYGDFKYGKDGYGKLQAHDYFKASELIKIYPPPKMTREEFVNILVGYPDKIVMLSHLSIKFPKDDEIDETNEFELKNKISNEYSRLTVPGFNNFETDNP